MNMFGGRRWWWSWGLLFLCILRIDGYCPNDEDLQEHRCTCSLKNSYIQCSSLPKECRTCYRYQTIFFDEHVNVLPAESFRFYDLFDYQSNKSFTIQFAQVNIISSNAFSKIDIDEERTLSIKIARYSSSSIAPRIFDELSIQSKAKFDLEIFNVTSSVLTIEQYAFEGVKFSYQSEFHFSILACKDTLIFQSNAGSILLPSYSSMDLYFSNFNQLLLKEHSFDHITEEHGSQLRITFDRFQTAHLDHTSFFDLHQLDQSVFHLTLSNFRGLTIQQTLFDTITQLKSSLVFAIYNMSTDLCLPAQTFSRINQDMNSTFQFEMSYGQNLLLSSNTFQNISQRAQSKLSIIITNSLDVYFASQALKNVHQEDRSLIDIWIKYGQNLLFEDHAIENIDIWRSSIMRIGYQHSYGTLQMASNAFVNINEGQGGQLLFQIIDSLDFYFRFNQSTKLERLEIVDRVFSEDDFCRIAEIPSHIPIKLLASNQCSCPIFYLYRHLRHALNPLLLKNLTPMCYWNLSLDQIELKERKCSFNEQIHHCQQMQGKVHLQIPYQICHIKPPFHRPHAPQKSSYISLLFVVVCLVFGIYIFSAQHRRTLLVNLFKRLSLQSTRQKLAIFNGDSYQQLTPLPEEERSKKILVKYNSITKQTEPFLQTTHSDFVLSQQPNEDVTLKLNTNPLSDIDDKQ